MGCKMKTLLLLATMVALGIPSLQADKNKGMIQIQITGLKSNAGQVLIALTNSKENYDSREEAYQGQEVTIKNKKATAVFTEIPHGTYAIKLYHDINKNGKLDSNFFGVPKEPYGFSNNARGRFGPPSFEKTQFSLFTDTLTVSIEAR